MIDDLIKYQQWRTGEIDESLGEIGLTPAKVTACINWAIQKLSADLATHDAEVAERAINEFCEWMLLSKRYSVAEWCGEYINQLRTKAQQ